MQNLNIEGSSFTFKKKPIIIIVVGMAGKVLFVCVKDSYFKILALSQVVLLWFKFYLKTWYNTCFDWRLGSGKTTFLHRLVCHTMASNIRGYVLNLDPAVLTLPFGANIDIRDTVRYKEVMKQYNLGPNGGILTSLNLFATKFDEVSLMWSGFLLLNRLWDYFFFFALGKYIASPLNLAQVVS